MAKYRMLVGGQNAYARCKGVVGHKWDDYPSYDRLPPKEANDRMVFKCLECGLVKVYYRGKDGIWWSPRYYNRPADWKAVEMSRDHRSQEWKDLYFTAMWKNGK